MTRADQTGYRLCSLVSKASGDDPAGNATPFGAYLGVEIAPPWRRDASESKHFPEGLRDAIEEAGQARIIGKFTGLMPDPEHSRRGHTRVLLAKKPEGPFAAYEKLEYVLPDAEVSTFAKVLAKPEELSRFEVYQEDTSSVRDLLVCTHGSRDVCCGKFGYPIYEVLRHRYAEPGKLRVWRTSHIGGHRFAPTILDLPEGRYWGYLEPEALETLAKRNAPVSELRRFYRGWAGLATRCEQMVEGEIFAREGWGWIEYLKEGRVLAVDGEEDRAEVRIEYQSPGGEIFGAYEATVEQSGSVMTLGSSGTDPLQEVKQYRVSRLEKLGVRRRAATPTERSRG